jgi:hypothetical protein
VSTRRRIKACDPCVPFGGMKQSGVSPESFRGRKAVKIVTIHFDRSMKRKL